MELTEIMELARQIGFSQVAPVNIEALQPMEEIRAMCAADRCNNYNRSWSCPPSPICLSLEKSKEKMNKYTEGVLLQYTGPLKDGFDMDGIREAEKKHKRMFDTLMRQLGLMKVSCFPMTSGGCRRCYQCTYPDKPCRHPEKLYVSMEAYGLWVSDVCKRSGLEYNYGENTITYTACILV